MFLLNQLFYTKCFEHRSRSKSLYARTVVGWNMLCLEVPSETKTVGMLCKRGTCDFVVIKSGVIPVFVFDINDCTCNWSFSGVIVDTLKNIEYTLPYVLVGLTWVHLGKNQMVWEFEEQSNWCCFSWILIHKLSPVTSQERVLRFSVFFVQFVGNRIKKLNGIGFYMHHAMSKVLNGVLVCGNLCL